MYGTKHKTEKIRPPSFKNLVDFLSLSLSFDGDDSDKLLLKLGRRASFTSFDLLFASSYFVVVLCVLSLFLSKMMMRARVEERAGVYYAAIPREIEKKREKEGETRFNWPESPFTERERFPFLREENLFFSLFFVLQFFFFLPERRTLLLESRRKTTEESTLSLTQQRNTFNTKNNRRERKKRIT